MNMLMFYQITMFADCIMELIIYMHTNHYSAYMSYQLTPVTESLITHFTGKRALTTMYAFDVLSYCSIY